MRPVLIVWTAASWNCWPLSVATLEARSGGAGRPLKSVWIAEADNQKDDRWQGLLRPPEPLCQPLRSLESQLQTRASGDLKAEPVPPCAPAQRSTSYRYHATCFQRYSPEENMSTRGCSVVYTQSLMAQSLMAHPSCTSCSAVTHVKMLLCPVQTHCTRSTNTIWSPCAG